MKDKLLLGVARELISPKIGCNLCGYAPDVISNAVHDDLTATAFYFKQGSAEALMISITVCNLPYNIADELRDMIEEKYGIPRERCALHATHTHSGPILEFSSGWGNKDVAYCEEIFKPRVMLAVGRAMEAPVAVKMGVRTDDSYIGVNRREVDVDNNVWLGQNPIGPFNPRMIVIAFKDYDGNAVANMVHYGMHGTCAGRNLEISRDWSGVMTDELEAVSGAITAFFNGPEGDVGPRLTNGETTGIRDVRYAERHGALAAADAVKIYNQIREYNAPDLEVLTASVDIPLEKRIPLQEAERLYAEYAGNTFNYLAAKASYYEKQIELYKNNYEDKEVRTMPQQIIRIGSVAFISSTFELFSEIGVRIAKHSAIPYALPIVNTNGKDGYFVTESEIVRGGYEVEMFKCGYAQPYANNADWHLIKQTVENLKKLGYGKE